MTPGPSSPLRKRALQAALGLLTVAAVAFVVVKLVDQWPDLVETWRSADRGLLAVGVVAFLACEVAFAAAWPFTMRRLGHHVPFVEGAALFVVTQTAKFVPGSIWQAVGRVEAAQRVGVPRKITSASLIIEAGASLFAAVTVGAVTGTPARFLGHEGGLAVLESIGAVAAAAAVVIVALRVAKRLHEVPTVPNLALIIVWQLVVWTGYGLSAAVVGASLGVHDVAAVAGSFCFSWAVGFVIIVAPAGLGVRETVMTTTLSRVTTEAAALAVAVSTRVVWTMVQLAVAAIGVPIVARSRRTRGTGSTPTSTSPSTIVGLEG